ncbi:lysophospholipid acyltransferase family protein [Rubrimonas cliftonensis]|uniref:Lyso-ornithine lipid acyltransferase n=1 Tax=Rubrimonas cliftonensis TaxID=89524 RepID=A0A1H4BIE7_9RHOB|nr:lysophospholipid acyltransferase family protein [Rubrimonas cliftonensis]SEA47798.1 lyso-ornithine lipid acyltransferase [Rubrimonas cliftonensis]
MSVTWNDAAPPDLPPLTPAERLRGGVRVAAMLALTAVCLTLFLILRFVRRRLFRGFKAQFWVARVWARAMLRLIGVRRRVIGAPIRGGGVWLANHASWSDILALRSARLVNFVSKAEVRAWPGIGWIAEVADTVFIERRRSRAHDHRGVLADRLRGGQLLCIFPEGTSSDGLRVLPFKSSLLAALYEPGMPADARVQPVTLNWIAAPGLPREFYGWWGSMPFEGHIWEIACRSRGGVVEIVFHAPCSVHDVGDRKAMTRWAEETVRAAKSS